MTIVVWVPPHWTHYLRPTSRVRNVITLSFLMVDWFLMLPIHTRNLFFLFPPFPEKWDDIFRILKNNTTGLAWNKGGVTSVVVDFIPFLNLYSLLDCHIIAVPLITSKIPFHKSNNSRTINHFEGFWY